MDIEIITAVVIAVLCFPLSIITPLYYSGVYLYILESK